MSSKDKAITSFFAPKSGRKRKIREEDNKSSGDSSTRQQRRATTTSELGPHAARLFSFLEPAVLGDDNVKTEATKGNKEEEEEDDDDDGTKDDDDKKVGAEVDAEKKANSVKTDGEDEETDKEDVKTDQEDVKMKAEDGSPLTWSEALLPHFASPPFESLASFVAQERETQTVYPPESLVFSALHLTPLHKVRVVVVGQDPYHGPNQAHGLSFSVPRGVDVPQSLRNMYKELQNDPKISSFPSKMPTHGNLEQWAKQGVLMLNAVLTVRRKEPNSHQKKGWESFTDEIIRVVEKENRNHSHGLVFLLWGRPASKKAETILGKAVFKGVPAPQAGKAAKIVRAGKHAIIFTAHPSPLSASRGFMGSRCFSLVNEALKERGYDPIDWNVDD